MKIECRIENSHAIIFFLDEVNENNKLISCYTRNEGHSDCQRAYMRKCRKPENPDEFKMIYRVLAAYFTMSSNLF